MGAETWWNNVCNALKIQLLFYWWQWFGLISLSLTAQSSISVNITIACRRKKPLLSHLLFVCSYPISLRTATASERSLLACLLSIFCTAPCNQHRHEWRLCPPPKKNTLVPYYPTTIHIHYYTHEFLYSRGHLFLDPAQLVNSWHHREFLCEIRNRSGICQRAAVNI